MQSAIFWNELPEGWELLAAIDESASYEVDVTEIYRKGDKFLLVTATGCSCWAGEYDTEEFDTLEALGKSMIKDDRQYNPSFKAAGELMAQATQSLEKN